MPTATAPAAQVVSIGDRFATSFGPFTVTNPNVTRDGAPFVAGYYANGTDTMVRADMVARLIAGDHWTKLPPKLVGPVNRRLFA